VVLGAATIATAFVSETLVGALRAFAYAAHLSEFFVAAVIVAIIGNATEHGSAVLLATEIPVASSAQIAGLVIPLIALISWGFTPLALSFRRSSCGLAERPGSAERSSWPPTRLTVAFYLSGDP
jgi:Ca2+:H+ antiporter